MTTVMKASTYEQINDLISTMTGYGDFGSKVKLSDWEICVYNEPDNLIRLTITHIESDAVYLNATIRNE